MYKERRQDFVMEQIQTNVCWYSFSIEILKEMTKGKW